MKKILVLVLVVVAAVVVVLVERGTDDDGTYSGTIESHAIRVGSLVGGRVAEAFADEGDRVERGAVLVRLEPGAVAPRLEAARARLDAATASLAEATAGPRAQEVERARLRWQDAERVALRLEGLLSDDAASSEETASARIAADVAKAQLDELVEGTRPERLEQARAAVAESRAALGEVEVQERELEITAPSDGVLAVFDLLPGDLVAAGSPVAEIRTDDDPWVRVYVPETELAGVRLGQQAEVSVDGIGATLAGRVTTIGDRAEYTPRNVQTRDQRADLVFPVEVTLARDERLHPGMTATVRLAP
ncbi:MAG: efflux RND transporter periplasmic adaptor subunit [Planctomycetota bacterium]